MTQEALVRSQIPPDSKRSKPEREHHVDRSYPMTWLVSQDPYDRLLHRR